MSRGQIRRTPIQGSNDVDDSLTTILHIDMDAFFASVELLERPDLRGKAVIVGGAGARGVVLSATYEARRFGVHSAMPIGRARRMCPHAEVITPTFGRYSAISEEVMKIFASITPYVEPLSLDEAFLDVSGAVRRIGSPRVIGELIRHRVRSELGITCSVGAASTKFIAKLASTQIKPDAILVLPPDQVIAFLHPLPVGALWGVGEKTEERLRRLGLTTVGEIAHTPESTLQRALGNALGSHLAAIAWGRDTRTVDPHAPDRSLGAEETFDRDVDDHVVVRRELLRLADRVGSRLRASGHVGRTVALKVRFADFTTISRSRTLPEPTDVAREIYQTATELYDALGLQRARLRLVGVRVEGLLPSDEAHHQLQFGAPEVGWREVEQAMDQAAAKFGSGAVKPARLLDPRQDRRPGPDLDRERPDKTTI